MPAPAAGRRQLAVFAQNRAASDAPWQRIETGTPVRLHDSHTAIDPIGARGQGFVACQRDSLLAFDATGAPTEAMLLPAGVVLATVDGDDPWGIVSKTKKPPWAFELVRLRAAWHPCVALSIEVVKKGKRGAAGRTEGRVLRWVLEGKPLDSERAVRRQLLHIAQRTPQPIVVIAPGRDAIYGDVALAVDAVRNAGLEGVFM
ncbi:MAG: hypothetical protein R3F56_00890 [Planctomycetota bacterium]